MSKKKTFIPAKLQIWIDARKRYKLSHMQVQMARELGMNPKKFGRLTNHKQESWKLPLPAFIEKCYFKRFKKEKPETVKSIEQVAKERKLKKESQKKRKLLNNTSEKDDISN